MMASMTGFLCSPAHRRGADGRASWYLVPGLAAMGLCTCCGCIDRAHFPRAAFANAESQNTMIRVPKNLLALAIGHVRAPCFDDGADTLGGCS